MSGASILIMGIQVEMI